MSKYNTGLICGKFYPLHKGHQYLIETGLKLCDKLTIVLCWKNNEIPSHETRFEWLTKLYGDNQNIILKQFENKSTENKSTEEKSTESKSTESKSTEFIVYSADANKLWATYAIEWMNGIKPDVLISSEHYSQPWADAIGCDNYIVDIDRTTHSVSGTMIRNDPHKYKDFLDPIVYEYYQKST